MLLAIDVGNTHLTLGLWQEDSWHNQWRLQTDHNRTADEYGIYLRSLLREDDVLQRLDRIVLASVVPPLTMSLQSACERYLGKAPLIVTADLDLGIGIKTDNPYEVGADRLANAVAAYHLYGGPAIALDMGTATTFDVISRDGDLLGVAIATGLRLSAEALAGRAAQLSRVAFDSPKKVIGTNTISAMQSGIIFGYAAMIEGLVARIKDEMGEPNATVIGTGGLITHVTAHMDAVDQINPWLTLHGLRIVAERNPV